MVKITVIVPVYNSEKYISRCVESVLVQTYSNWELLLIDDGSKDDSLTILKAFALKDCRIKVIHQENAGAGAARNVGIENASGDYIVFIDSDDFVAPDFFSLIVEKNTDVVFLDVCRRKEDLSVDCIEKLSVYANTPKDDVLRNQMTGKMLWGGVRKAVKSDVINSHQIRFSQHKVGEEAIYSFLVLYFAKNYSFIDKPVYNYILHNDSLSHSLLDDPWGDVATNLKSKIVELDIYEKYADTINAFFIRSTVSSLYNLARKYSYEKYLKLAEKRIKKMRMQLDHKFAIDWLHIDARAIIMYPCLKLCLLRVFFLISYLRTKI